MYSYLRYKLNKLTEDLQEEIQDYDVGITNKDY